MRDASDFAKLLDPMLQKLRTSIRRMALGTTAKAVWQLIGFSQGLDTPETGKAEAFTGIGFFARPPTSGKPEAIVLQVGGTDTLVIVAVRDEATRAAIVGALKDDESAMYNSKALFLVTQAGGLEARSATGTAAEVAPKSDLDALRAALSTAVISLGAGGAATVVAAMDTALGVPWPVGTKKFKAE